MILVDFNGLLFQYVHSCVSFKKPEIQDDGYYNADDIITPVKSFIISELFDLQNSNPLKGNVVLCVDNVVTRNWRKELYKKYKSSRVRNENDPIPIKKIFSDFNILLRQINDNTPWKVVSVDGAEGDDCILTIASKTKDEDILIISSDKDMIQAQKNPRVTQYSPLTRKWLSYKTKDMDNLNEWIMEHVILGDSADSIPRIFDEAEFTDKFRAFLKERDIDTDVHSFNESEERDSIIDEFHKSFPDDDVYIKLRIGPKTVQKMIKDRTVYDFVSKYKSNFERNKKLVLAEYIPSDIQDKILSMYNINKNISQKNIDNFINYLGDCGLYDLTSKLPTSFRCGEVTIDDFF